MAPSDTAGDDAVHLPVLKAADEAPQYGGVEVSSNEAKPTSGGRATHTAFLVYLLAVGEGYDLSVFSTVLVLLDERFDISPIMLGTLASCHYVGMVIGALASGSLADRLGRKISLSIACCLLVCGCLTMGFANDINTIVFGRAVLGVGVGIGIPVGSLYIVEIAPPERRGTLGAGFGASLILGTAIGAIAGALLQDTWQDWRVMILLGCILPGIAAIGLLIPWFPDSPRWLVSKGLSADALHALELLHGDKAAAESTLHDIEQELQGQPDDGSSQSVSALFNAKPAYRPRVKASLGTAISIMACGFVPLFIYFPLVLKPDLGRSTAVTTCAVIAAFGAIAGLLSTKLSDICGRRPLLVAGYCVVAVTFCMWSCGSSPYGFEEGRRRGWWLAFWFFVGALAFQTCIAPVTLFYVGEILPSELRAIGVGIGNAIGRFIAFLLTFCMPVFLARSTFITFGTFMILNVMIIVFMLFSVVETRGVDLEKIGDLYSVESGGTTK